MAVPEEERRVQLDGGAYRMGTAGLLPVGFRFRPTDEELLLHYLRRKALSCPLPADVIPVADLARLHPWELPGDGDGDGERYFFHLPATASWRKGGGGAAGTGAWRVSGKEKPVLAPRCGRPVGAKRTLVFLHRGGARSDWAMHEYRLLPAALGAPAAPAKKPPPPHASTSQAAEAEDWLVCRIFKKTAPSRRRRTERRSDMPAASASSCVTDSGKNGGGDEDEEEEIASN